MKHKKIIFLLIFSLGFVLANIVVAADKENTTPLSFIPSMTIPGLYTAGEPFSVDGSSLAKYIVAIYRYGGMFAGVVAMFMLVYAGWEWLLAGGNSSKISQARDKINGVLTGLALLFGGYILLSLISQNLVSFEPLDRDLPKITCSLLTIEKTCLAPSCKWVAATPEQIALDATATGLCMDISAAPEPSCSSMINEPSCTSFSTICEWDEDKCVIKEKCNVSEEEYNVYLNDDNSDFSLNCCAIRLYPDGFSNYQYAIFGSNEFNNSCTWVCGSGSLERPREECAAELNWGSEGTGASSEWY